MPKSRKKRKNGKTKKANGSGLLDNARQGKPNHSPIPKTESPEIAPFYGEKLLAGQQLITPPNELELEKMGITLEQYFNHVHSLLYGSMEIQPKGLISKRD